MALLDFKGLAIFWFPTTKLFNIITDGVIEKIEEIPHKDTGSCRSAESATLKCPETAVIQHNVIRQGIWVFLETLRSGCHKHEIIHYRSPNAKTKP